MKFLTLRSLQCLPEALQGTVYISANSNQSQASHLNNQESRLLKKCNGFMVIGWFIDSSSTFPSTLALLPVFSQVCWAQAADHHTSHTEEAREESRTLSQAAGQAQRGRRNVTGCPWDQRKCAWFRFQSQRGWWVNITGVITTGLKRVKLCTYTTVCKEICEILLGFTSSDH